MSKDKKTPQKKKNFLRARFSKVAGHSASSGVYASIVPFVMIDGGVISIPIAAVWGLLATSESVKAKRAFDEMNSKHKPKTESEIEFSGPGWACRLMDDLQNDLLDAIEAKKETKAKKILQDLAALEQEIEVLTRDHNDQPAELLYMTRRGTMSETRVRDTMINSKGQNRRPLPKSKIKSRYRPPEADYKPFKK